MACGLGASALAGPGVYCFEDLRLKVFEFRVAGLGLRMRVEDGLRDQQELRCLSTIL